MLSSVFLIFRKFRKEYLYALLLKKPKNVDQKNLERSFHCQKSL